MEALGLLEFVSIAKGIEATDSALKAGRVELLLARPICPGKYIAVFSGEVAAVRTAIEAGKRTGEDTVIDELIIPNIHPSVLPAVSGISTVERLEALGIIETFSCASCVEAADAAAKAAEVKLIEVSLGLGIGGKSFVTLTGDVAAVRSSVDAGSGIPEEKGLLVRKVVIPSPREELTQFIV
ncbi:propanediol utilization protein [bacterium]|nr:MAG: propanediol utilization protein [bacterium]